MAEISKYTTKLSKAHVLIIGGSSGIGYCVAEASLESGARVTISSSQSSRVESSIERLLKTYPSAKDRVSGHACNLSGPDLEANIKSLFEKVGEVDHVVFTAGDKLSVMPLEEATLEKVQQAGMVRFFAPLLVAKYARKYFSSGPAASYTMTSGSISEHPIPAWSVVAGYASGLHAMTRNLALDLAPIRVNLVIPGAVETPLWEQIHGDQMEEMKKKFVVKMATGRIGRPEDVAESYLYVMRDHNLTGSTISTNGGELLN